MESAEYYRQEMVKTQLVPRGISDKKVLDAMSRIPRHLFINNYPLKEAYSDKPLPIKDGQTISQPYIVALMCEACCLKGHERVLEIGTGSGYMAAILSLLAKEVYTIERLGSLYSGAGIIFEQMNMENITSVYGDGYKGLRDKAPYDAIIVSAAPKTIPSDLKEQLSQGGLLVIPVGSVNSSQSLKVIRRQGDGFKEMTLCRVRFVPMIKGSEQP